MKRSRKAGLLALALSIFAVVPTASASTANISASVNNTDPFYYYSTRRTNTYTYNCMSFTLSSLKPNTGSWTGDFMIRVTRPNSTTAIAELTVNYTHIGRQASFTTGGYGCRVPYGEFRLGVRANGYLSGSNPITGQGVLTYNIQSAYTGPLSVEEEAGSAQPMESE